MVLLFMVAPALADARVRRASNQPRAARAGKQIG